MAIILANILQSFPEIPPARLNQATLLVTWDYFRGRNTPGCWQFNGFSLLFSLPPSIHKLHQLSGRCSRTQQKQALGSKPILKHTYWCAPACVYKRSFHSRILYTLKIRKHNSKAILNATNSSFIWHKQSYEHGYQLFEPFKSQNNPDLFVLKDQIGPVLFPVNFTRWTP